MGHRQRLFFVIGCWAALATAAVHLVGQLGGPPPVANDTERTLHELMATYRFPLPGAARTLEELLHGFGLTFSVALTLLGGTGLHLLKRAGKDAVLMRAVAQANAVGALTLVAISLRYFFIIPTVFLSVVAFAFGAACFGRPAPAE